MFEHSAVLAVPEKKTVFIAEAERRFDRASAAFTGNPLLKIYGGENAPGSAHTAPLAATAATLSVNWPMFTAEVRYTDRVLSYPHTWPRTVATGLARVDDDLLYSTVTGDPGAVKTFPMNSARFRLTLQRI